MSASKAEHVGIKYLHLVIVSVLAITAMFYQFWNWMVSTPNIITLGLVWLMLLAYELVIFLIQLTWKFFTNYLKQVIPDYKPLGFKTIIMFAIIAVGLIWLLFNFFKVLPLAVIPGATMQSYGLGLTILWIGAVFIFFLQMLWAVAHRLSEK